MYFLLSFLSTDKIETLVSSAATTDIVSKNNSYEQEFLSIYEKTGKGYFQPDVQMQFHWLTTKSYSRRKSEE
jgi:hypothetical protein